MTPRGSVGCWMKGGRMSYSCLYIYLVKRLRKTHGPDRTRERIGLADGRRESLVWKGYRNMRCFCRSRGVGGKPTTYRGTCVLLSEDVEGFGDFDKIRRTYWEDEVGYGMLCSCLDYACSVAQARGWYEDSYILIPALLDCGPYLLYKLMDGSHLWRASWILHHPFD